MTASMLMHEWIVLVGSLGAIAFILMAFGFMLGIVKPGDAMSRIGAILGIMIALMLMLGIILSAWSAMPLWQRVGLVTIGIGVWLWGRTKEQRDHK